MSNPARLQHRLADQAARVRKVERALAVLGVLAGRRRRAQISQHAARLLADAAVFALGNCDFFDGDGGVFFDEGAGRREGGCRGRVGAGGFAAHDDVGGRWRMDDGLASLRVYREFSWDVGRDGGGLFLDAVDEVIVFWSGCEAAETDGGAVKRGAGLG